MKHLNSFNKLYESTGSNQIYRFLKRASKSGDITLNNISVEDLANKWETYTSLTNFEDFVDNEANFISEHIRQNMREYVDKLKEIGADVSKLESLWPDFIRLREVDDEIEDINFSVHNNEYGDEDEPDKELDKLYDESNKLLPKLKEFEEELVRVAKEAKKIMD